MDLVELQRSAKRIRNPFKFDFVWTWNKQAVVLKGDGQWHTYVGPLAQHLAWHLFQKVKNQYHDEQVKKLRRAGDSESANKFQVTAPMEDKIWIMITGERMHTDEAQAYQEQEAADLTELESSISDADTAAASGANLIDFSSIIESANNASLMDHNDVSVSTNHVGGAVSLNDTPADSIASTPDIIAESLPPVEQPAAAPATPAQTADTASQPTGDSGTFEDLENVDHE